LIYDAKKNNRKSFISILQKNELPISVAGSVGNKRPVLSSWHKAYQKRTLSIGSEIPEDNYQRAIGASTSDHNNFPLALRRDVTGNHQLHSSSSIVETCDTAGYLELINNLNDDERKALSINLNPRSYVNIPTSTLTISSVFLGAMIIMLIWYFKKQKKSEYLREKSDDGNCITITPPSTPVYHQLEKPFIPPFQSRLK
jgi:hypothetical protein